jgi:hypothetical protein
MKVNPACRLALGIVLGMIRLVANARAQGGDALPEGCAGIAARYPGDQGIQRDPAVLFADDFHVATVSALGAKWDFLTNRSSLSLADASVNRPGRGRCLAMTLPRLRVPRATGVAKVLPQPQDVVFLRWYQKFDGGWLVATQSVHNGGSLSAQYFPGGPATPGVPADGKNTFLVGLENENSTGPAPGNLNFHVCWPGQAGPGGDHFFPSGLVLPHSEHRSGAATFGKDFVPRPEFVPQMNRWYCYEFMVRANTPGQNDGRLAMWIDGRLVGDFLNLRLRDVATLKIDRIDLGLDIAYNMTRPNRKWVADVVAATAYIGPLAESR